MKPVRQIALAAAITFAGLCSAAISQSHELKVGSLVITHPWSRQSPRAADVAAGFFSVTNTGTEDDRLVKATASISPMVQLHDMQMDGDVMKMVELPGGIAIPAGTTVDLKPGSLHVMFMQLKQPVMVGEEIRGTLVFEKAGPVEVQFEVLDPDAGMN
jgi:copper(I)-binding protein